MGRTIPPETLAVAIKFICDVLNGVLQVVKALAPAIMPVIAAWAAYKTAVAIATAVQTVFNAVMAMNPLGLIVIAIGAVVAALAYFFTQTEQGRQMWQSLCDGFNDFTQTILPPLQDAWNAFAGTLNDFMQTILPFLQNAWNGFLDLCKALQPVTDALKDSLGALAKVLGDTLGPVFSTIGDIVKGVIQVFKGLCEFLSGVFTGDWGKCWQGIQDIFSGTWNAISSFFTNIWNGIKNGTKAGIDAVFHFVTGLKDKILGFFRGAGQWLLNAGKAILDGFLKGLKGAWDGVCNFVGGIGNWIAQHKGPISYDKKLLIPAGNAIMQGFSKGLGDSWQGVQKQVAGFTKQTGNWFNDANAIRLRTTVMPPDGGWNAQQNQIAKVAANYEVDASRTGLTKQDLYDAFDGVISQGVALKLNGRGGEVMAGILAKPMNNELNKMATLGR